MGNKCEVLKYWDEQALKYKDSSRATSPDDIAFKLEMDEILKYLDEGQRVLNIGCGNGVKDFFYCKEKNITLKGIDFSHEMIKTAKEKFKDETELKGKLDFDYGDVLDLKEDIKYDVVITDRCLINLSSHEEHIKAISNIYDVLKDGGCFLMMECSKKGLEKINDVRDKFGLESISERWHNVYLDEQKILDFALSKFSKIEINNFNSMYFLVSRTLNALLTKTGEQIDYNSELNRYSAMLPPVGDFAPLKLFILTK